MSNIAQQLVNNKTDIVYYRAFKSLSKLAKLTLVVQIIKVGVLAALIAVNIIYLDVPYGDIIICCIINLVASCFGLVHYLLLNFRVYCNVELFTSIAILTNHVVAAETISDKTSIQKCVSETVFLGESGQRQVDLTQEQRQTHKRVTKNMITSSIKYKKQNVRIGQNLYQLMSLASLIYTIVVMATTSMPTIDTALLSVYVVIVGLFTTLHIIVVCALIVLAPIACCIICFIGCCCACCLGQNTFGTKAIDIVERQATTVDIVNTQGTCSICQMNIALKQKIYVLPCSQKHIFHGECLRQWTRIKTTCPLCRADIPTKMGAQQQIQQQDSNRQVVRVSLQQESGVPST